MFAHWTARSLVQILTDGRISRHFSIQTAFTDYVFIWDSFTTLPHYKLITYKRPHRLEFILPLTFFIKSSQQISSVCTALVSLLVFVQVCKWEESLKKIHMISPGVPC